jgi:hypothetical protein
MALEYALSNESAGDDGDHHRQALERAAGTIQEYAHAMIDENEGRAPAEVPADVSTAIAFALDSLYEPVAGIALGAENYLAQLTGDDWIRRMDRFVQNFKDIVGNITNKDPTKSKFKRVFRSGERKVVKARIVVLERALQKLRLEKPSGASDIGIRLAELQGLKDKLDLAK